MMVVRLEEELLDIKLESLQRGESVTLCMLPANAAIACINVCVSVWRITTIMVNGTNGAKIMIWIKS